MQLIDMKKPLLQGSEIILLIHYLRSATRHPWTLSKPRLCAASAAQAIVFTLAGAKGQSFRTGPKNN